MTQNIEIDANLEAALQNMTNGDKETSPSINLDTVDLSKFTPEQAAKIIENMSPAQISAAFARVQSKSDQKAVKPKEEPFKLTKLAKGQKISLYDLIALDKTPIPNASIGMRTLVADNVQSLLAAIESGDETRINKIPPMELQGSNKGPILISGYHRCEAYRQAIENTFLRNPLMLHDGVMTQEAHTQYVDALKNFYVKYNPVNLTEAEIPFYAYDDNLAHGAKPDESSRSNMALLWYKVNRQLWKDGKGPKVTQEMAENKYGVSRIAMFKQKQRNEGIKPNKKAVKLDDSELEPEIKAQLDDYITKQDNKAQPGVLEGGFTRIINAAMKIADEQLSESELVGYVQDMVNTEQKYKGILLLTRILSQVKTPAIEAATTTK